MKDVNNLIQACADCLSACKCATNKLWQKGQVSEEEKKWACMWNDAATACEACIHLVGRSSPNADKMVQTCDSICEACAKESMKIGKEESRKVVEACKKVCDTCKACSSSGCRKCA